MKVGLFTALFLMIALPSAAAEPEVAKLVAELRALDSRVFPADSPLAKRAGSLYPDHVQARVNAAIEREARAFDEVKTKVDWARFRAPRLKALRDSLRLRLDEHKPAAHVTGTRRGVGHRVENLVYASSTGLAVTANLYLPEPPRASMPGIVVCHGFHNSKEEGELQDIGVSCARMGCAVLIPDLLGHGERRQHPFGDQTTNPHNVVPRRQDYYFRYNVGVQLMLIGESLMGWMVADTIHGVDLLLSRPGVDPKRIAVLGAVAGGGDIAAVVAALDERIAVAVPFNFGGPEPETPYPLPANPERTYPIATGHWDSTRRLRNSLRDGFPPWFIVAAIAPRGLIYAHEFAWDREHDPVWKRLEKVYASYSASDRLAAAHGSGTLFGKPEGTGCANIGVVHRRSYYPALARWLTLPEQELVISERRPPAALKCLASKLDDRFTTQPVHALAHRRAQIAIAGESETTKRVIGGNLWRLSLGAEKALTARRAEVTARLHLASCSVDRLQLVNDQDIPVPILLLLPARRGVKKVPLVVAVAEQGKEAFLRNRSEDIAKLLTAGVAVCLPDLTGTGETRAADDQGGPPVGFFKEVERRGGATFRATQQLTLGRTVLGDRLQALRVVLEFVRGRSDLDSQRIALWGDSFAPVNPATAREMPWGIAPAPALAAPSGGVLALVAALSEKEVVAVYTRGCIPAYFSLLDGPCLAVAGDALAPDAALLGDLLLVAEDLWPRPVRLHRPVDALNRELSLAALERAFGKAHGDRWQAKDESTAAEWLLRQLR